jgi:hypothetical protein
VGRNIRIIELSIGNRNYLHQKRGAHKVLVGKPEGKRPRGRLRLRNEYNIKMNL